MLQDIRCRLADERCWLPADDAIHEDYATDSILLRHMSLRYCRCSLLPLAGLMLVIEGYAIMSIRYDIIEIIVDYMLYVIIAITTLLLRHATYASAAIMPLFSSHTPSSRLLQRCAFALPLYFHYAFEYAAYMHVGTPPLFHYCYVAFASAIVYAALACYFFAITLTCCWPCLRHAVIIADVTPIRRFVIAAFHYYAAESIPLNEPAH